MAETRTCGSCTLCCKILGIVELDKPQGRWCAVCKPGVGCQAYDQRPQSCRDFSCAWLTSDFVPDELKPDRSKVVLALDMGGARLVAYPDSPADWRREPMQSFLKQQSARSGGGWHVVLRFGDQMSLVKPDGVFDMGVIPPKTAYQIDNRDGELFLTVERPGLAGPRTTRLTR
jgi:hypothetical protein